MKMPARTQGFTLIEVLAALIIVSLGMLAVIEAVSQTVNNANYLREKTLAHWVGMNKLTEVRLNSVAPAGGDSNGDIDMAGTTWHWRMNVTATSTQTPTMQRIDIKVAPKSAGADASIASISGFYGSALSHDSGRTNWDVNPTQNGAGSSSSSSAANNTNATGSSGATATGSGSTASTSTGSTASSPTSSSN